MGLLEAILLVMVAAKLFGAESMAAVGWWDIAGAYVCAYLFFMGVAFIAVIAGFSSTRNIRRGRR